MPISNIYSRVIILAIFFVLNDLCFCMPLESMNASLVDNGFSSAVATWYGSPTGSGSGGSCGFGGDDVANAPYYGMTSAGNNNIFKSGAGCGACYMVKCTEHPSCSGNPITVTITNECPGACNNEAYHFDLSGKAFGFLSKPGQNDALRQAGRINVQYQRVQCHYDRNIAFKIDQGSNKYYLSFSVENVSGAGEITHLEILRTGSSWQSMQRIWGETWKFDIPEGGNGPYSIRITAADSKSVFAGNVIPRDWIPGKTYYSSVNF